MSGPSLGSRPIVPLICFRQQERRKVSVSLWPFSHEASAVGLNLSVSDVQTCVLISSLVPGQVDS